jgi:outer membrane protein OmpA-like peptidoglycan-associated protein
MWSRVRDLVSLSGIRLRLKGGCDMRARILFTKTLLLAASVILLLPLSACLELQHGAAQPVQVSDNRDAGMSAQPEEQVRLEGLRFKAGGASLRSNSKPVLIEAADILKSEPSKTFYVDVHCDQRGSEKANLQLAQQRAENVKAYLEAQGVPSERMIARGFGTENSASSRYSSQTHRQTSRVELIPLADQTVPTNLVYPLSGASS